MAAGAGAHQHQPVDARLQRLLGMPDGDHVVKYHAAIFVHFLDHVGGSAQAGDDHRHAAPHADIEIVLEPIVGLVDDLVHREGCDFGTGMGAAMILQGGLDRFDPALEHFGRSRIQGGERSHHPAHALRDDEIGIGNDEHRRRDHGQRHAALELLDQGHRGLLRTASDAQVACVSRRASRLPAKPARTGDRSGPGRE